MFLTAFNGDNCFIRAQNDWFYQKQAVCLNKNDPKSQLVSHSCQIKTIRLRNYVDFFIPFCELSVKIPNVDKSEAKLKCY